MVVNSGHRLLSWGNRGDPPTKREICQVWRGDCGKEQVGNAINYELFALMLKIRNPKYTRCELVFWLILANTLYHGWPQRDCRASPVRVAQVECKKLYSVNLKMCIFCYIDTHQ
jgi:hypothetical protein